MKKIISLATFFMTSIVLSGCSSVSAPKLYGNESCGSGKTAYVYASGNAAVCLNESSVVYMICARELAILSAELNDKNEANLTADVLGKGKISAGASGEGKAITTSASTGVIAEATAKAINTCIEIHKSYK